MRTRRFWWRAFGMGIASVIVLLATSRVSWADTEQQAGEVIRFAVIGDYGTGEDDEAAVADMVKSWEPDFIITTGDNNYPDGTAETIDRNVGQYYHAYIYPYRGNYGPGADTNRFFPALGNHDWHTPDLQPYYDYFTLPGNERYYDFVWGPVHFFVLDSDDDEPDGNTVDSVQAEWLRIRMAASEQPWKIVYLHHTVLSSGKHGPTEEVQWPFRAWGATAVFSGHDHLYERLVYEGVAYFVNGAGGGDLYPFVNPLRSSVVRYNKNHGAMLVEATPDVITFEFYSIDNGGSLIDSYTIDHSESALAAEEARQRVFVAQADTTVWQEEPDENSGSSPNLRVDGGADDPSIEVYLQFAVQGITSPIQTVMLRLYATSDSNNGPAVYPFVGEWAEHEITWETGPSLLGYPVDDLDRVYDSTWVTLDVTPLVTGNGVYNFALVTNDRDGVIFSSREGEFPPELIVTVRED